eukprot:scaffold768_cov382-Prasinococcus_capsulatus_cf.AAC.9
MGPTHPRLPAPVRLDGRKRRRPPTPTPRLTSPFLPPPSGASSSACRPPAESWGGRAFCAHAETVGSRCRFDPRSRSPAGWLAGALPACTIGPASAAPSSVRSRSRHTGARRVPRGHDVSGGGAAAFEQPPGWRALLEARSLFLRPRLPAGGLAVRRCTRRARLRCPPSVSARSRSARPPRQPAHSHTRSRRSHLARCHPPPLRARAGVRNGGRRQHEGRLERGRPAHAAVGAAAGARHGGEVARVAVQEPERAGGARAGAGAAPEDQPRERGAVRGRDQAGAPLHGRPLPARLPRLLGGRARHRHPRLPKRACAHARGRARPLGWFVGLTLRQLREEWAPPLAGQPLRVGRAGRLQSALLAQSQLALRPQPGGGQRRVGGALRHHHPDLLLQRPQRAQHLRAGVPRRGRQLHAGVGLSLPKRPPPQRQRLGPRRDARPNPRPVAGPRCACEAALRVPRCVPWPAH